MKALRTRKAEGPEPRLSDGDRGRLAALLVRGAVSHGGSTDLWTTKRVAALIEREFGVRYHFNHVGKLLASMGFTWQKPRRVAREKDGGPEAGVDAHEVGEDPNKLRAGATVVFEDESGFSLTPLVARTWSPAGETPSLLHAFGRWEKLSAISAVAVRLRNGRLEARLYFRLHPGRTVRNAQVASFLRQLSRHLRGRLVVVWDNAGQHRGTAIRAFLASHPRFEVVPLPPYCPELNPDEDVWAWVKSKDLANLSAQDDRALIRHVRGSMRRMARRPWLLTGALRRSELPWGSLLKSCGGPWL